MTTDKSLTALMSYLAALPETADNRLPALSELSKELNMSVATLREQLEVARTLGVVEVKPKTGIRKLPYDFYRTIKPGLTYALACGSISFHEFADLRKHLEAAYFLEAAQLLTPAEIEHLEGLISSAKMKLTSFPGQIPVEEHREFHTFIYRKLENPYLDGMLAAFWDVYHSSGFEVYPDLAYLERVWQYHSRIIEEIKARRFSQGLALLLEHIELVAQRERTIPRLSFE